EPDAQPEPGPKPEVAARGKKIKNDLDKIMDDIDEVLEENAEEFVKNFVQRGGQ
ncbi:MAG: ubiquitin-like protein Pup, partial [Thermodesulfobacteriota bacterium]